MRRIKTARDGQTFDASAKSPPPVDGEGDVASIV
jgi:hypothetical protein